jgi:hypothetical protein
LDQRKQIGGIALSSDNFWDKLSADLAGQSTGVGLDEASRNLYKVYKSLTDAGFEPSIAAYLLGEMIKGVFDNGKN